jgi:hypothetical protein
MSWILIAFAPAAAAVGVVVKWYLMRGWARYCADPKAVVFPKLCPVCLGMADVIVEEDSSHRVTADYIVVRQLKWWSAKIPHCSKCQRKQVRYLIVGLVLGAMCAISIFIFTPAPEPPREIVFYAFFVYPFYVLGDNLHKGVAFGWADAKMLSMRIRRPEYFDKLMALNSLSAVADVPLADNKGVWRH